jgi:hypothetical protein
VTEECAVDQAITYYYFLFVLFLGGFCLHLTSKTLSLTKTFLHAPCTLLRHDVANIMQVWCRPDWRFCFILRWKPANVQFVQVASWTKFSTTPGKHCEKGLILGTCRIKAAVRQRSLSSHSRIPERVAFSQLLAIFISIVTVFGRFSKRSGTGKSATLCAKF